MQPRRPMSDSCFEYAPGHVHPSETVNEADDLEVFWKVELRNPETNSVRTELPALRASRRFEYRQTAVPGAVPVPARTRRGPPSHQHEGVERFAPPLRVCES